MYGSQSQILDEILRFNNPEALRVVDAGEFVLLSDRKEMLGDVRNARTELEQCHKCLDGYGCETRRQTTGETGKSLLFCNVCRTTSDDPQSESFAI